MKKAEIIRTLADWIEVDTLAASLYNNLEDAKEKSNVTTPATLEELQDFYLNILDDIHEQAKSFVAAKPDKSLQAEIEEVWRKVD